MDIQVYLYQSEMIGRYMGTFTFTFCCLGKKITFNTWFYYSLCVNNHLNLYTMFQERHFFRGIIALIVALIGSCDQSEPVSVPRLWGNLNVDGQLRTYLLNLPPNYGEGNTFPLVVALHGTGGSAEQSERDYRLTSKSDMYNYVIVYPEGIPRPGPLKIRTWNAGECCDYAVANNIDDVEYIATLMDYLIKRYKIDPNKVFVTGMSNGAMMAYRLACELPRRIKAIAPVSGTLMTKLPCASKSMPILHIHSELDEVVPYNGGIGLGGYNFHSVDSTLRVMADINRCPISPRIIEEYNDFTYRKWVCQDDIVIESYLTKDGGHSWPGGLKPRAAADEPSKAIDATQLIFDFFETYN